MTTEHDDPYDTWNDCYDIDGPTHAEEKAYEIALDVADEQRRAEEEGAAGPQPGHTETCEGCHGTGGGYEDEVWDDDAYDLVTVDHDRCPECGGCGFYDCDGACETDQD
ncbi:hypothetical protein ACGFZP_10045 [Kitasatospora sp. NPDC048239]|uniref:hypothetical protein n=1 Tax=Kitasatospora sp. NPDC048239 TaxID=3364046 RepID=UPI00371AA4AC